MNNYIDSITYELLLYIVLSTHCVCAHIDACQVYVCVCVSIAYEWLMEFKYLCNYPQFFFSFTLTKFHLILLLLSWIFFSLFFPIFFFFIIFFLALVDSRALSTLFYFFSLFVSVPFLFCLSFAVFMTMIDMILNWWCYVHVSFSVWSKAIKTEKKIV